MAKESKSNQIRESCVDSVNGGKEVINVVTITEIQTKNESQQTDELPVLGRSKQTVEVSVKTKSQQTEDVFLVRKIQHVEGKRNEGQQTEKLSTMGKIQATRTISNIVKRRMLGKKKRGVELRKEKSVLKIRKNAGYKSEGNVELLSWLAFFVISCCMHAYSCTEGVVRRTNVWVSRGYKKIVEKGTRFTDSVRRKIREGWSYCHMVSGDEVFIEIPCREARNGKLILLVDSGADATFVKLSSIKENIEINGYEKRSFSGAFGGAIVTLGKINIVHGVNKKLKFSTHIVSTEVGIPADGILGRDNLWGRSIINAVEKEILFMDEEKELVLKMKLQTSKPGRDRVNVPARSVMFVRVRVPSGPQEIILHKTELKPGVYLGETLGNPVHGFVHVPLMNSTENAFCWDGSFQPELSPYHQYKIVDQNNFRINTIRERDFTDRIQKLMKCLPLDENLNYEEKAVMKKICESYHDVFLLEGDPLSYTTVLKHRVPTLPGEGPINQRQYRIPQVHKAEIDKQVQELLDAGIIRHSMSPWNSPLLLVSKKPGADGKKKWRMVVDYRKVNDVTIKQVFPLPRIDEILDQLGHSRYFTTLDLASGYHQVQMDKDDAEKTAFSTGTGHYEFTRMPFGLTGAPATFQRIMNHILTGLQGVDCFVYLDDIVIYGRNLVDHETRLMKVLQLLRENNLKLKTEKCQFLRKEVVYLGHVCSEDGARPDPHKVKCVTELSPPRSVKEIQSVMGLFNYYRKFIDGMAEIALPITTLTKKGTKFVWDENCQLAFKKLKEVITTAPLLIYPDFSKPFLLTTDASGGAIGAVLSQGEPGEDLPIAYASRALSETEKRYSTIEKECLAIVWATHNFRPYLLGRQFEVFTDHQPLRGIANLKDQTSRLANFRHKLSEYDFEIHYKPGKKNQNADALSRIPYESEDIQEIIELAPIVSTNVNTCNVDYTEQARPKGNPDVSTSMVRCGGWTRSKAEWNQEVHIEEEINLIDANTIEIEDILDEYMVQTRSKAGLNQETNEDEELNFMDDREDDDLKIEEIVDEPKSVIKLTERIDIDRVLKDFHDSVLGGHQGALKTHARIRQQFSWPGMLKEVQNYVKNCPKCQVNKSSRLTKMPLMVTDTPKRPFEKVFMDIVGPLPETTSGNKYILTFLEDLSKYLVCIPIPDMEASTVASVFFDEIISRYGVPKVLVTDNGTNFTSRLFTETCKLLGVKKVHITPYHPQANGSLERSHRPLAEYLRNYAKEDGSNWDRWLTKAMHVHNNSMHVTTKQTPFKSLYGFDNELPTNLKRKCAPLYNSEDTTKVLKYQLQRSHQLARENQVKAKEASKRQYDDKVNSTEFAVGQKVLMKNQNKRNKLSPIWNGPFEVNRVCGPVTTEIVIKGKNKKIHNNLLKHYFERDCLQCYTTTLNSRGELRFYLTMCGGTGYDK